MATKTCPNGHQYDSSIYGDNCPFCPESGHTHVTSVNENNLGTKNTISSSDSENYGATIPMQSGGDFSGGHTVIRSVNGTGNSNPDGGRKVIGLLVSYTENPAGEVYKVYEGRNIVGRANTCDIVFGKDDKMSGRHLLIQYIGVKGVVKAQDLGSSNGTFVNGQVYVIGDVFELKTNDVIVLGGTKMVFLSIPEF